jgi:anti-anti-sigma factor
MSAHIHTLMSTCLIRFRPTPIFASEMKLQLWTHHSRDRAVVHCIGELTYKDEADALVKAISSIRQRRIAIDLKHVRKIDAYGLGKLLYLKQALAKKHQVIDFNNPSEMLRNLFCITKLDFQFACDCGRVLQPVQ